MTLEKTESLETKDVIPHRLQLVAWEITAKCNLFCAHCRGSATSDCIEGELTIQECFNLVDQILEVGNPILILTGGEPLCRPDFMQIAEYAANKGLRVVLGTNGTLLDDETAARLKAVLISRVGISLDFPIAELQDEFRGKKGAYDAAMHGIDVARKVGIEVQINSTITKLNVDYLEDLLSLALEAGAVAFHPFLLVPTGRGKGLEAAELSPEIYEQTLNWIYDKQKQLGDRIFFKPTDAPHYLRVMKQRQKQECEAKSQDKTSHNAKNRITRGCLAGTGFCFVSSRGKVKGCGYFDVEAGDIKKDSFAEVWNNSPLFQNLRNLANLKGKCGGCEYKRICGGCRARAYEATGDYLEAEPYCIYQPRDKTASGIRD